jgi:hypothetical protein
LVIDRVTNHILQANSSDVNEALLGEMAAMRKEMREMAAMQKEMRDEMTAI